MRERQGFLSPRMSGEDSIHTILIQIVKQQPNSREVPLISAPQSVSPLVTPQPMKIHLICAKSGAVLSQSAKTPVPAIETLINQRVGSLSDSHPLGR